MSKITFSDEGWEDYLYWQSEDKKTLKKINKLIKDITRDPFNGIGKPEPLKENLTGYWSRRIDDKSRNISMSLPLFRQINFILKMSFLKEGLFFYLKPFCLAYTLPAVTKFLVLEPCGFRVGAISYNYL